ncbi:MAG: ribonuclease HI family protein [Promethearchaeia archaeon]
MTNILKIYTDGAARGNPGPAAAAFVLVKNDKIIEKGSQYIGKTTNNAAEYKALILALKIVAERSEKVIKAFSDSQLMVRQLTNIYKVRKKHLQEYHKKVRSLQQHFKKVSFKYVSRDNQYIEECDRLCNERLDQKKQLN